MNLDDLRAVQVEERGTDSLQSLPDSFYRDVAAYIEGLREERERAAERAENPFDSEEVRRLTDEIETAEEVVEAVYERRVGKVVKRASLAAAGMPADEAGLTDEETELFARLVDEIEANREQVLAAFDGDGGDGGDAPAPATEEPEIDAGAAMGGDADDPPVPPEPEEPAEPEPRPDGSGGAAAADPDPDEPSPADDDRVTLRITRDVGEVFGVDERVYELDAEDVVTLPAANAGPLLDRDAAQKLE